MMCTLTYVQIKAASRTRRASASATRTVPSSFVGMGRVMVHTLLFDPSPLLVRLETKRRTTFTTRGLSAAGGTPSVTVVGTGLTSTTGAFTTAETAVSDDAVGCRSCWAEGAAAGRRARLDDTLFATDTIAGDAMPPAVAMTTALAAAASMGTPSCSTPPAAGPAAAATEGLPCTRPSALSKASSTARPPRTVARMTPMTGTCTNLRRGERPSCWGESGAWLNLSGPRSSGGALKLALSPEGVVDGHLILSLRST
mmetsp:Transcript_10606/g.28810  ORF Transcript_10606/g.28810 Transcript_10606/m.28810 type:complete len:255 (+) Transcript_10606:110-874(+)